jgi:hypothetical protein
MKKGVFFTLDVSIALTILVTGALLLFMSNIKPQTTFQSQLIATDAINAITGQKVIESANEYLLTLRLQGQLEPAYEQKRVIELFAYWLSIGRQDLIVLALSNYTNTVVPINYNIGFYLNNTHIYNRSYITPKTIIVQKRLAITTNQTQLIGPFAFEVKVW